MNLGSTETARHSLRRGDEPADACDRCHRLEHDDLRDDTMVRRVLYHAPGLRRRTWGNRISPEVSSER